MKKRISTILTERINRLLTSGIPNIWMNEINDYILAHLPDDAPELAALSAEELSELIARSKINSALSGIKGDAILFRSIYMSNVLCPYLHIRLGIGNELVNTMKVFI